MHVEQQMGQNGYLVLDKSTASIFFFGVRWWAIKDSKQNSVLLQRRLTNILLSGDHQSLMYHNTNSPKRSPLSLLSLLSTCSLCYLLSQYLNVGVVPAHYQPPEEMNDIPMVISISGLALEGLIREEKTGAPGGSSD